MLISGVRVKMDIERLARKLEPLTPQQVQRWLLARDQGDAELRTLIDKQIRQVASRKLGDIRNKILLSLPPKHTARGSIDLGTVLYEQEKWPAGISKGELLQGLGIFGRSGAGKTNAVFHVLRQLDKNGIVWTLLDWKRTGRHLLPQLKTNIGVYTPGRSLSPLPFNPLTPPPGLERDVYLNLMLDTLCDAYTLGVGSRSMASRAIEKAFNIAVDGVPPTMTDVLRTLDDLPAMERERGWRLTTRRALECLATSLCEPTGQFNQEQLVDSLINQSSIIELDAQSANDKAFLIPMLCLWIYYVKLAAAHREKLSMVLVIEEAHHILHRQSQRARETVMEMLLRQCREIGIGVIVVDQHPHLMSSAATGNIFSSICLNLRDPRDVNKAAALSGVGDEDKGCFSRLPVGQGVVKLQDRWREPFLVRFPQIAVAKGTVTDAILRRFVRQRGAHSGRRRDVWQGVGRIRQVQLSDEGVSGEGLNLLEDVLAFPEAGVRERYLRLGLSSGRGNTLKERLLEAGWLEALTVPQGQSRKVVLRLSRQARHALGLQEGAQPKESIAHEYWKHRIARELRDAGHRVAIEAPRAGGRVDVLAEKKGRRIGIEVETGASDVVGNTKNCLRSGFQKVIVVGTSQDAMTRLDRALARADLLGTQRLMVCRVNDRDWLQEATGDHSVKGSDEEHSTYR